MSATIAPPLQFGEGHGSPFAATPPAPPPGGKTMLPPVVLAEPPL
jgi:hypothetical protein